MAETIDQAQARINAELGITQREIDFKKVKGFKDLKALFEACRLTFEDDGSGHLDSIKHLFKDSK